MSPVLTLPHVAAGEALFVPALVPDPAPPEPPVDPAVALSRMLRGRHLSRTRAARQAFRIVDLANTLAMECREFAEKYPPGHAAAVLARRGIAVPRDLREPFGGYTFATPVRAAAGILWLLDEFCERFAEGLPPRWEPRAADGTVTVEPSNPVPISQPAAA